jgi:hypothetical protein
MVDASFSVVTKVDKHFLPEAPPYDGPHADLRARAAGLGTISYWPIGRRPRGARSEDRLVGVEFPRRATPPDLVRVRSLDFRRAAGRGTARRSR